MLAGTDHSQTKLLSFSHLTTNYPHLILSTQFERTMIALSSKHPAWDWQAVGSAGEAAGVHSVTMKLQRGRVGATATGIGHGPR